MSTVNCTTFKSQKHCRRNSPSVELSVSNGNAQLVELSVSNGNAQLVELSVFKWSRATLDEAPVDKRFLTRKYVFRVSLYRLLRNSVCFKKIKEH
jgi:hypothetical protein